MSSRSNSTSNANRIMGIDMETATIFTVGFHNHLTVGATSPRERPAHDPRRRKKLSTATAS